MLKIKLIIGLVLIGMLLFGCMGKNGVDGKIFLKIQLHADVTRYWDDNDGIPYQFDASTYYRCSPDTYHFEYDTVTSDDWVGTYTITAEKGSQGGFMRDGEDGKDKYYTLNCHPMGPSLVYYVDGKSGTGKAIQPQIANEDTVEIIHNDGIYRIHLKASRKPGIGKTKSKI